MIRVVLFPVFLLFTLTLGAQSPLDTIVLVQYNVLRYGQTECGNLATRNSRLLPIFDYLKPDVLGVNEISPNSAVFNNFELNALSYNSDMTQTPWGNTTGSDIVNGVFYNSAKLGYLGHQVITGAIRDIDVHRLYHKTATKPGDTLDFYYIIAHFKASNGGDNVVQRAEAAGLINDWLQMRPSVTRYLLGGDLNLYTTDEPAWQTLVEQTQQFYDPSGLTTDWVGSAYSMYHTQSPASSSVPCAVTGGMDDRFDFLLASPEIDGGNGRLDILEDTYRAVGNDGNSYNNSLQCSLNQSVPPSVCEALRIASDHLPITMKMVVRNQVSGVDDWVSTAPFNLTNTLAKQHLLVNFSGSRTQKWYWQVFNMQGQNLLSGEESGNQKSIIINSLSTGWYFIRLHSSEGERAIFRFLKN